MLHRSVALALAASLLSAPAAAAQDAPTIGPRGPEVVADGQGLRSIPADRASVIVSVETRARTPSAAGVLNAARNNAIRAAITGLGVPREDVVTYGYVVYAYRQDATYGPDSGYVAANALRVTLRRPEQLALLGRVIDTSLTAGATNIAGVRHDARRTDEAERAALADAVADARARAEAIARAAGGSLGELLLVTTQPAMAPTDMMYSEHMLRARAGAARMRAEPTTVTAGEIEIRQDVVVRWRYVPARR